MVTLALGNLRQENLKLKASLCCIVKSRFKREEETGKRRGKEEKEKEEKESEKQEEKKILIQELKG